MKVLCFDDAFRFSLHRINRLPLRSTKLIIKNFLTSPSFFRNTTETLKVHLSLIAKYTAKQFRE
jgi:hypothetical protein